MSTATQTKNPIQVAKTEIVDRTAEAVRNYVSSGKLHLPADYSAENAVKAAWLTLQETVDKEKRPVLEVCTKASIANALMSMIIQGLDPAKKQCYFIAYGPSLVCQRSYFGDIALAKRVRPGIEVNAEVFYEGDEVGWEMHNGKKVGIRHIQDIANLDDSKLKGAYCVVTDEHGEVTACELMTMERIRKSWGMSKTYKPDAKFGTHHDFPADMAMRTVIRRTLKPIINSSSDELLMMAARQSDMDGADAEVEEAAAEYANNDLLAIESTGAPVEEERIGTAPETEEEEERIGKAPDQGGETPF